MPRHRITHADVLAAGIIDPPDRTFTGVGINPTALQDLGTPIAATTNTVVSAQAVAGAGSVPLVSTVVTVDVPRCLVIVSSNVGDTTGAKNITITGRDRYGRAQTEVITPNGTTPVNGNKAFKTVTRVDALAALLGNLSIGVNTKLGIPARVTTGGFISGILAPNTADAGTFAFGDDTAPSTVTTDSIGLYTPAGALNGANRYFLRAIPVLGELAYGIQQASVSIP